jgi:hypothetical protein
MPHLRMILWLAVMVPAWGFLGAFARLDVVGPGGVIGGLVVGAARRLFRPCVRRGEGEGGSMPSSGRRIGKPARNKRSETPLAEGGTAGQAGFRPGRVRLDKPRPMCSLVQV